MNESYFLVEQAVFSVNLARRSSDGRNEAALVAASEGASRADLVAALDWATRLETFSAEFDPLNLFFLPTPSGAFAIGRLTPATQDAEKGAFYFQMFFVEEDAFFQCGANPVALLHLALNTAKFSLYRPGARLEAFRLETRAPWIDQEDLRRTTTRLGTRALTTLIQTVLASERTTFVADYNAFLVVAALFELTPIHWRPALTFAVGLRFRGDFSLRLNGATTRRGVEGPRVEDGTTYCDLRDVVENDDAYPLENAWAALVETALKGNRVDYLYERTAEDFFLYQKERDDGGDRVASSEEVAKLGAAWRSGLEDAILNKNNETVDADVFADEEALSGENDASDDDAETFFGGEFEGGWRDSDGDDQWRVDVANETSETPSTPEERVARKFVFKVVEPNEAERAAEAEEKEREKEREKNATRKTNDNKEKRNGDKARSLDEIFAGASFEEEWAATESGRESGAEEGENRDDEEESESGDEKREPEEGRGWEATLEALRRVFAGKNGVAGTGGTKRKGIAVRFEEFLELVDAERAFDEPLGLDGLANLNALLDERGAEALERLRRATRRDGEKSDADDRRSTERNARRLRLAPFAALSAEFPGWNEELRKFDALFDDACAGNETAENELRDFWRRWRRELDDETVVRIRGAYEERLLGRLSSLDGGAVERTDRLLTALAIYGALFLER